MAGLKLSKFKKISINKEILDFNNPKYIYINLENVVTNLNKNDKVLKGDVIASKKDNFQTSIYSSVSGIIKDINDKQMIIENDFKEKEKKLEIKNTYTKEEFVEQIKNAGIIGLGGAGFPTYIKYKADNIKTLIVNAVECEPYITADYTLSSIKTKEILDGIDNILKINNIEDGIIAIKKNNFNLKEYFIKYISNYKNICIREVPNLYPMGWEKTLVKQVKHTTYNKLPIEKGIIINNVSTVYAINEALKYGHVLTDRIITVTGLIENPCNIKVKIGTKLKDIIKFLKIDATKYDIIVGGPMMGKLADENLIIEANMNCILFLNKVKEMDEEICLRCGKCTKVCPALLDPVLIKDNLDNIEKLKILDPERCVECGLCSYICPAIINLREKVIKAKLKIRKEKI